MKIAHQEKATTYEIGLGLPLLVKPPLYNMSPELQSQNRVYINCEKTTGLIYLKFWQKFLL